MTPRGPRLRAAVAGAVLLASAVAGCSAPHRPGASAGTSGASSTVAAPATPTATPTPEPSTDDDFRAIYLGLVPQVYAFVDDPLHAPADVIDCTMTFQCSTLRQDARKGRRWTGVDGDNLTVGPVTVLERVNRDRVQLAVTLTIHGAVTKVDRKGKVLEKHTSNKPVRSFVEMVRTDGHWRVLNPVYGDVWDLPLPARKTFSTLTHHPLDNRLNPVSDPVDGGHGVRWQRWIGDRGDDCLRVWEPGVDVVLSCVTYGGKAKPGGTEFLMQTTKLGDTRQWVSLWFARGTYRTGYEIFADGTEHATRLRKVGSLVGTWKVGVGVLKGRPEKISAHDGTQRIKPVAFGWPPGGPT